MNGRLSPVAQQKLLVLSDLQARVQRLHGLVEQYATTRANPAMLEGPIRRSCDQIKQVFMGAGYGALAQLAGSLVLVVKRGGAAAGKARALREGVGTLRSQIDGEQRAIAAEGRIVARPEPEQK